jgi:hypothetical protein
MSSKVFSPSLFKEFDFGANRDIVINFCKFVESLTKDEYQSIIGSCQNIGVYYRVHIMNHFYKKYSDLLWSEIYWGCSGTTIPYAIFELMLIDEILQAGEKLRFVPVFGDIKRI